MVQRGCICNTWIPISDKVSSATEYRAQGTRSYHRIVIIGDYWALSRYNRPHVKVKTLQRIMVALAVIMDGRGQGKLTQEQPYLIGNTFQLTACTPLWTSHGCPNQSMILIFGLVSSPITSITPFYIQFLCALSFIKCIPNDAQFPPWTAMTPDLDVMSPIIPARSSIGFMGRASTAPYQTHRDWTQERPRSRAYKLAAGILCRPFYHGHLRDCLE